MSFSFTYVSIAVRRYTSLQPPAQNDPTAANATTTADAASDATTTAKRAA